MPIDTRAIKAARNNASWCDAVCRAHGLRTDFSDAYWSQVEAWLPLYPNLVTTSPEPIAVQMAGVTGLVTAAASRRWAVKDSFAALQLGGAGAHRLFDADWVHREPHMSGQEPRTDPGDWETIESAEALADWEAAWGQRSENSISDRVLRPELLADPDVAFIAVRGAQGAIVAGVVAKRATDAVGFSNVFTAAGTKEALSVCVTAAASLWPDLPLVGYASGEELQHLRALAFDPVGPLRVWAG